MGALIGFSYQNINEWAALLVIGPLLLSRISLGQYVKMRRALEILEEAIQFSVKIDSKGIFTPQR